MSKLTLRNFLLKLLEEEKVTDSALPKTVRSSADWATWLTAGFVEEQLHGRNRVFRVAEREALQAVFAQKFPNDALNDGSAVDNVRAFGDSKARARVSQNVCLLRGWQPVLVNGHQVDLAEMTDRFGLFSAALSSLDADRICLVENLDTFGQAEQVVGTDWLLVHTYGRVGKTWLQKVCCREMLVFSDYDLVGLDEFLRVQEVLPQARFFVPEHYETLWNRYAKPLKKHNESEQLATRRVSDSQHPTVVAIREQVLRTGKFLEQQALFV